MSTVDNDSKKSGPPGRDDSSAEAGIPTGEKVEIQHVEKLDTTEAIAGVKPSQVYENMAPIVELGLPDWRATEKQLVRRLDMSLMPTSKYPDTLSDMIDQQSVVAYSRFTSLVALFQQLPRPYQYSSSPSGPYNHRRESRAVW
jgi:hypothetical protein